AASPLALLVSDRARGPLSQARALLNRYDKQANVDQAVKLLLPLVEAKPEDPAAHTLLAEGYWRQYEHSVRDSTLAERAGKQAGTALTLDQSYAPVHVVLAMINLGLDRSDGALGEAQRAIALDPDLSRAWRELGRVHFRLGQRAEAEKDFRKAVALDPDDWTAHNSLGSLYLNLNRLDEAIAEYDRMQAL